MNYLFFDIECANCFEGVGKICEFGYVLTDENLNVIKQGIHLINPDAEFDWYVKHKIISYSIKEYENAHKYPQVYEMYIRELMELPDTIYIGHGVGDDIKYLNDEAKRYNLPRFEREWIDSSLIHKNFYDLSQTRSLKVIVKELEIGDSKKLHNSKFDALMTLEYVKLLCAESGLSFTELSNRYNCIQNGNSTDCKEVHPKKITHLKKKDFRPDKSRNHMMRGKKNHSMFRLFIAHGNPVGEKSNKLSGKKITVSMNYEAEHFKEMVILAGLIKAAGGEYEIVASKCDLFATFEKIDGDGIPFHCNRNDYVNEAIKNGRKIEIISLDELLLLLGTNRNELESMPALDIDYVLDEKYKNLLYDN